MPWQSDDVEREKYAEQLWEYDYINILRWRLNLPQLPLTPGTACSEPGGWFGTDGKIHTLSERAKDRIQRKVMKRVDLSLALETVDKISLD